MNYLRISPQNINYFLVSLLFIPRFFSDVIYQPGTVLVLIFWISPFVIVTEIANEKWNSRLRFSEIPKLSFSIQLLCLVIIVFSFYWRHLIYSDTANSYQNIKRALYLLNPLLLISWLPFIGKNQKQYFLKIFATISISLFLCLSIPYFIRYINMESLLNNATACLSGLILDILINGNINASENFIHIGSISIEVSGGCSSTDQMIMSLYASLAIYICCKISSIKSLLFYVSSILLMAFTFNAVRIAVLGCFLSAENQIMFDFWHHGAGSLIFSFIVMFLACSLYYFIWVKENPLIKNKK